MMEPNLDNVKTLDTPITALYELVKLLNAYNNLLKSAKIPFIARIWLLVNMQTILMMK